MEGCLFCKIVNKELDSDIVYEDDDVMVFKDVSPVAPVHFLAIPKKHLSSIMEIDKMDCSEIKEILKIMTRIAADLGLQKNGFRVVTNVGPDAGQSVDHLHFHLLGKRKFTWPPG